MQINYSTPKELKTLVKQNIKTTKTFFRTLKKKKNIDHEFSVLHNEAFGTFNCLDCANCCSSISPIILQNDIDRIAKYLKISASEFLQEHLYMDEDGDFVFNQTPCPFLLPNNYCSIYESRPKACRKYPHTDRRKMYQILDLTLKNCEICPIVYGIVEEIKKRHNF